jgi:hypothetical protein
VRATRIASASQTSGREYCCRPRSTDSSDSCQTPRRCATIRSQRVPGPGQRG